MMYKTIDLCAGIGGIRRGFELTGRFENVLSAEIDEYAARTYEHLFHENPRNDLASTQFKKKVQNTEYDVLLAGFPCQTFSSVGKKAGFEDKVKGTVFYEIVKIVRKTRPKAVFLENVQNLLSHDKGRTFETIIDILENNLKYMVVGVEYDSEGKLTNKTQAFKRNTISFGWPQNRPRVYIIAFDKKRYGNKLELIPKRIPTERIGERPFESVQDVLEDRVDAHYYMSSQYLETLKRHKVSQKNKGNGFGYCVVNRTEKKTQVANTILATGGSGKERNLIYQPVQEYSGIEIKGKASKLNTEGIRVMTPLEWARLQGFAGYAFMKNGEDSFSFPDGMAEGQKYKQLGNSVSIPVVEEMAKFMLDCFAVLDDNGDC